MNRREILKGGMAAGVLGVTALSAKEHMSSNHFYELRTYEPPE